MGRTPITSPNAAAVGPYSHAIDDGRSVYLSGQTPIDPDTGGLLEGSVGAQTHQCFDNLFDVLMTAGLSPSDVVQVRVYVTDMGDFAEMNAAYAERFTEPYPARTTIGVASLPLGAQVEIDCVAVRPDA
ncbi:MAG: RidA family protein [Acidobacteria bacterium]|nr:RidA family protein [Acidobacteriota bacterium]